MYVQLNKFIIEYMKACTSVCMQLGLHLFVDMQLSLCACMYLALSRIRPLTWRWRPDVMNELMSCCCCCCRCCSCSCCCCCYRLAMYINKRVLEAFTAHVACSKWIINFLAKREAGTKINCSLSIDERVWTSGWVSVCVCRFMKHNIIHTYLKQTAGIHFSYPYRLSRVEHVARTTSFMIWSITSGRYLFTHTYICIYAYICI